MVKKTFVRPMNPIDPDASARGVFVVSDHYPAFDGHWHLHRCAQFVYACEGVLTSRTAQGLWIAPAHRGVWIPAGMLHKASASKPVRLCTLYVSPGESVTPASPTVVSVDPLLDALLTEAAEYGTNYPLDGPEQRLMRVVLDRLPRMAAVPSYLPTPSDPRLVRLTDYLEAHASDRSTLEDLASACGMTSRTAARLFIKETGLAVGQWRQQLRLLKAMQHLGQGDSVTKVAADVGYQDVSAFITAFKQVFGETPARYFRQSHNRIVATSHPILIQSQSHRSLQST